MAISALAECDDNDVREGNSGSFRHTRHHPPAAAQRMPEILRSRFAPTCVRLVGVRVAVFSDVHGNLAALEAVLDAAAEAEVDEYWIVGDLVAHGPRPAETARRLAELPSARIVRGNTDRYVLIGALPARVPSAATAGSPAEIELLVNVATSFAWTRGALTPAGDLDWLDTLPVEHRLTLPDRSRVLLVHAAPGTDDGRGLTSEMSDEEIRSAIAGAEAELIFAGHTHLPMDRTVDGVRVVNPGSVSLSAIADRRAWWSLLTADSAGYAIEPRQAAYDLDDVCADLDRVRYPSAEYLRRRLHG